MGTGHDEIDQVAGWNILDPKGFWPELIELDGHQAKADRIGPDSRFIDV